MTCRQLIEFLSDFHDHTLPDDQRARFESHLRECPECRRYVDQFSKTVELTQRLSKADAEVSLPKELVRAIVDACAKRS